MLLKLSMKYLGTSNNHLITRLKNIYRKTSMRLLELNLISDDKRRSKAMKYII